MVEMVCVFFAGAFFGAGVLIAIALKHDDNKKHNKNRVYNKNSF